MSDSGSHDKCRTPCEVLKVLMMSARLSGETYKAAHYTECLVHHLGQGTTTSQALLMQGDLLLLRSFIQLFLCYLSRFFCLWPTKLQREMCRSVTAHILVRNEVVLSRGKAPDRLYFILSGQVSRILAKKEGKKIEGNVVSACCRAFVYCCVVLARCQPTWV